MNTETKISALQCYLMLFLSRAVITLTINSQIAGEENFLDNILSAIIYAVLLWVFSIPLLRLNKNHTDLSVPDIANKRWGNTGLIVSSVYTLYFFLMNTHSLALFLTLLTNTMNPSASTWSIVFVITAIALYGAIKGIEAISRAAICIVVLFLLGFATLFVALIPRINFNYIEPVLYDGTSQMVKGVGVLIARCTSLAEFAIFMPFVKDHLRKGFALWNVGVAAFVSVLILFLVSCLGEYAYIQIFPVYTMATMAEIAGIQRLDAMLVGLSMMALVIRIACGLFAISACWVRTVTRRVCSYLIGALACLSALAALWIIGSVKRTGWIFETNCWLILAVLVNFVLPVFIVIVDRKKRKRV